MKCSHCNGECCYLDKREGTTRYAQLLSHGKGVHYCKHCKDGTQKHRKGSCVIFLESGMPCEDCDLEDHSVMCNWHKDWHNCDCGKFDIEESK